MKKKQTSPGTIGLMIVGIVAALGFAVWQVTSAMGPGPAPAKPAGPTTAAAPATGPGTTAATAATAPTADKPQVSSNADATLNPNADPFTPLATPPAPVQNNAAPIQRAVVNAAAGTPYKVPENNQGRLPSFTGVKPMTIPNTNNIVNLAPEPELVGTLLGDRPSAVFKADNAGLAVVPKGATLHGWKVIDVQHGSALVKNNGVQVKLVVGGMAPTGNIKRGDTRNSAPSIASNSTTETAPAPDVQNVSSPTPQQPVTSQPDPNAAANSTTLGEGGRIQGEVSDPNALPTPEQTPVAEQNPFNAPSHPAHSAPIKLTRAYTPTVEETRGDTPLHRLVVAARQSQPEPKPASGTSIERKQKTAPAPRLRRKRHRIARRSLRRHKIARATVHHHRHKRHRHGRRHHSTVTAHHASHASHQSAAASTNTESGSGLRTVGF